MDNIIEYFKINGVHGYKDIAIRFVGPATVVVAENGTGKTTLFNAINAFLSRRFHRLSTLSFESIECKFSGHESPLILEKNQIGGIVEDEGRSPFEEFAERCGVSSSELIDFLRNSYVDGQHRRNSSHPFMRRMYISSPFNQEELQHNLDELYALLDNSLSEKAKEISSIVRALISDMEIVYLPTYRRIERPLMRASASRRYGLRRPFRGRYNPGSEQYDDMAFGLSDVEERLAEISEEIERKASFGYRSLSAKMLDEILRGRELQESIEINDLPDIDSLTRFLNRVGRDTRDAQSIGGMSGDIKTLYSSGKIGDSRHQLLRYFLSRLGEVVNQTREMEFKVEKFVDVCNGYLELSGDTKKLSFDPATLKVLVRDSWAECSIPLDDLSSGEKQIISLMSRLYLSGRPKIVLIDEPELSLSLDWQRKVLPDVISSGSVVQMLAITHSPFIFENDLDECVRPLEIARSRVQQ